MSGFVRQRSPPEQGNFGEIRDKDTRRIISQGPGHFGITTVWNKYGRVVAKVDEGTRKNLMSDNVSDVVEIHVPDDLAGALQYDAPAEVWERFKALRGDDAQRGGNSDQDNGVLARDDIDEDVWSGDYVGTPVSAYRSSPDPSW